MQQTTNITHIANLAGLMAANDIQHVVVSPGSRNAPLVIAFDSHPDIKTYVVHDERSAAFFALGLTEAIGKPVTIVCTSGSAALNYAPAVAEAYYRQLPLLVLTADRPDYLIDQGDGQCIRQDGIYSNYIKSEFKLPDYPKTEEEIDVSNHQVELAIRDLKSQPTGPVHINIPLHEPLYEKAVYNVMRPTVVNPLNIHHDLTDKKVEELINIWDQSEKKLIIVGQQTSARQVKPIMDLIAENSSVAILVENTSNLQNFHKYCHCIDRTLALIKPDEIESFAPDLLISFGGAIVSKKIKAFFRRNRPKHNWRVGQYLINEDTFLSKTETVLMNPADFLRQFAHRENTSMSNFGNRWKGKDFIAQNKQTEFLARAPYSDLTVFDLILDTLPDNSILQMANSSVVRYCQLFNPIQTVSYFSNRGVSGIDGSTSTAVGMAFAKPNQLVTLITGDISFFYDSNALWNSYLPANLRIILINNGGGGIFNILEGSRKSEQNEMFVAPHQANAASICQAFNVEYVKTDSLATIGQNIGGFYQYSDNNRPKLLEIDTTEANSHFVLMDYFKTLAS